MAKKRKKLKKKQTKQTQSSVDVSAMKEKSDKSIQDFDVLMAEITGNPATSSETKSEPEKADKQADKSSLSASSKKVAGEFVPTMVFEPNNTELDINLLINDKLVQLDKPTMVFYPVSKSDKIDDTETKSAKEIQPETVKGIEDLTEIKPVKPLTSENEKEQKSAEIETAINTEPETKSENTDITFTDISENDEYTIQKQDDRQLTQDLSPDDKSDIIGETGSELTELEETPTPADEEEKTEIESAENDEAETKTAKSEPETDEEATPQEAESIKDIDDKPADGFDLFYQEQRHQYLVDTNISILVVLSILAVLSFIGWI